MAALKAHPEVKPGVAALEALLASFGSGLHFFQVIRDVSTGRFRHLLPP
jgi:hypothetical protein